MTNELHIDPGVVDLLISFAVAATRSPRANLIFNPFPPDFLNHSGTPDFSLLEKVLHSLPSTNDMLAHATSEPDLRAYLEGIDKLAYRLVRWILTSNRAHLVRLPSDKVKERELI